MSELNAKEISKRFSQFIMMQAQNIMYVLGRIAGPDGSAPPPNLRAAKLLIDQLEMIQAKTKGNLSEQESSMLNNILSEVRLIFVETSGGISPGMIPEPSNSSDIDGAEERWPDEVSKPNPTPPQPPASPNSKGQQEAQPESGNIPSKRKFFKSYG
jgi:hypothetical protein